MNIQHRTPRVLLAADAFLFAGTLDILLTAVFAGVVVIASVDMEHLGATLGPVWGTVISVSASVVLLLGGALAAWFLHRGRLELATGAALTLGAVAGLAVSMSLLVSGARIFRMLRLGPRTGPPWAGIVFLALLVAAFLALPYVDAVRDLESRRRRHVLLDRLRLVALPVAVLLAVVVLPWMGAVKGADLGEAGIFAVPFASAAAIAVVIADFVQVRLRPAPQESTSP